MPSEKAPPAQTPPAATPNKSKRAFIAILVASILLLLVGAMVVFFIMFKSSQADSDDDDDDEPSEEVKTLNRKKLPDDAPAVFIKLDKFTVNLKPADDGSGADAYMQVDITLQVDSLDVDARLKNMMPRIRNDVTFIMSDKQANSLMSREGKEALSTEIRNAINLVINPLRRSDGSLPEGPVKDVLFESIIIQ